MSEKSPVFALRDREYLQSFEKKSLARYACLSESAADLRARSQASHPYRTEFQRDRDRIIHSRAFRRLKHKRQVFHTNVGDHYRTRLTHTMEVTQIARTMARALGLNEDLTEAVALGHDLGHTPFGHLGEYLLDEIMQGKHGNLDGLPSKRCGGFKHNYQSVRILDLLEKKYRTPGLNLTAPVREGVIKHTRLKKKRIHYADLDLRGLHWEFETPTTLEGQIVAIADEIAQRTHDLEDGVRAGLVEMQEVRKLEIVQLAERKFRFEFDSTDDAYFYQNRLTSSMINLLVDDVIETAFEGIDAFYQEKQRLTFFDRLIVDFSPELDPLQKALNKFIYQNIIYRPMVNNADDLLRGVLLMLFQAFALNPELLPNPSKSDPDGKEFQATPRLICDHIAGMTDFFALSAYKKFRKKGVIQSNIDLSDFEAHWMR